jgi:hypothetical protein
MREAGSGGWAQIDTHPAQKLLNPELHPRPVGIMFHSSCDFMQDFTTCQI